MTKNLLISDPWKKETQNFAAMSHFSPVHRSFCKGRLAP